MKKLTAIFILFLAAGAAKAETRPYARAMFGAADAMQGAFTDRNGTHMTSSYSFSPTFSAALGAKFESNIAVEAEFYTVAAIRQRGIQDQHTSLTAYTVNVAEFFPFHENGKINPFVGVGLGVVNSTFFLAKSNALAFNAFLGAVVNNLVVLRLKYLTGKTYGSPQNIFALEGGYKFNL